MTLERVIKNYYSIIQGLREAYAELLNVLPEEKRLGHIIINLPSQKNFQEKGLFEAYNAAEMNMKTMYSHFQKHGYLLSDDEQKEIVKLIEVIDTISKSIIDISSGLQVYNIENDENEDASIDKVYKKILEKLFKVTEFEETYYNIFKNNLSKLSKWKRKCVNFALWAAPARQTSHTLTEN